MRSNNYNAYPAQPNFNHVPSNPSSVSSVFSGTASAPRSINHQNGNVSNWNHFNVHRVQANGALSTTTNVNSAMINSQSRFDPTPRYYANYPLFQRGNPSSNLRYLHGTSFSGGSTATVSQNMHLPYVSMYGTQHVNVAQSRGGPWLLLPQYSVPHEAPRLSNNFSHYGTQNAYIAQAQAGPWLPPQNSAGHEAGRLNDNFRLLGLFGNQNTTIAQDQGGSWILPYYSVPPESARLRNNASLYGTQNASVPPRFLNVPRHLHIVLPRIRNAPLLRILPEDEVGILEMLDSNGDTDLGDEYIDQSHINHIIEDELILEDEGIDERSSGVPEEAILSFLETRTLVSLAKDEETKICIICWDGYEVQEKIGALDCGHEYHRNCIKQWLLVNNRCPVCRRQALDDDKSS